MKTYADRVRRGPAATRLSIMANNAMALAQAAAYLANDGTEEAEEILVGILNQLDLTATEVAELATELT